MEDKHLARFWTKVERTSETCWLWKGTVVGGYGQFWDGTKMVKAHRYIMGATDPKIEVDHKCRVTLCVLPAHLELVTHQENCKRRSAVKTHCPLGHPYDEKNTYNYRGHRVCRRCQTRYKRNWTEKKFGRVVKRRVEL